MRNLNDIWTRHWKSVVAAMTAIDHVLRFRESPGKVPGDNPGFVAKDAGESKSGSSETSKTQTYISAKYVALMVVLLGPVYGTVMGSYALVAGERGFVEQIPQMIYSGVKVPLLIAATVLLSLPSYFVINTLVGLRDDFRVAVRAIVSAQAGLTIILVSLAPVTLFVNYSLSPLKASYAYAVLFNAMMFGLASVSAQILLAGYYRPLIAKNSRHRVMVRVWIFVYAFVGIQAGHTLRPFIGSPDQKTTFFRDSFENAYVRVFDLFLEAIGL